ncbi:hypothetical protein CAI16_02120 [Virgibacillus dokdonensis]|uniref:YqfQ-like protein n=1 Tax=Virgibacillus dokdonensis TaxID=302167 RepID=A0A3E0WWE0_9BACI|nr:VrrA/YqfQ family protein [Virgibacillus dokdonensis]RFA37292.1 hypothetical protein CAI16_02120 [Virgibacillus dokdonensis]
MIFPPNRTANFPFHMQRGPMPTNIRAFNPQQGFPRAPIPSGPLSGGSLPGGQSLSKGGKLQNLLSLFQPQAGAGVNSVGSGFLSKGVGGLSGALDNVQQVLNVVQNAAPIVQEYGPMVKNLPRMYRMMKAFNSLNDEDIEDKEKNNTEAISNDDLLNTSTVQAEYSTGKQEENNKQIGKSVPKLFI